RQSLDDRTGSGTASQLTEGFEHWIISFFAAETLDTLPASNPYFHTADGLLMKHVNQCGLSDAGLTRDEYYLPLTSRCSIEGILEFGQCRFAAHHSAFGIGRGEIQGRRNTVINYRSDELIATPGERLYKAWFVVVVPQHLADPQDVLLHDLL